jgi:hypothetical protein
MYQGAVLLDFHDATAEAELQLPVERLQVALGLVLSQKTIPQEADKISEYILCNVSASAPDGPAFLIDLIDSPRISIIDGAPYVVARLRLIPPSTVSTDLFNLRCDVLFDRVPAQVFLVSIRTDWRSGTFANDPRLVSVLRDSERSVQIDRRTGTWWHGFASVFRLGMRHIAEGTDHILFLLVLLFPAPLLVLNGRWVGYSSLRRCFLQVGSIVTAFTVGHSLTLAAGAMNLIHVPSRPIEVLIAVSILVSAIHAVRPAFPGREAVVAGCFGLVHGLAFATTLAELGLSRWDRVASIFGFNLGIEVMQLVVVAVALPSLILLSRSRFYPAVRTGGALCAGVIALTWIAERLWDLPDPAGTLVEAIAQHGIWLAICLTLLGLLASPGGA